MQMAKAASSSPSQQYGSHLPLLFTVQRPHWPREFVLRETDRTEYLEFLDKTVCVMRSRQCDKAGMREKGRRRGRVMAV